MKSTQAMHILIALAFSTAATDGFASTDAPKVPSIATESSTENAASCQSIEACLQVLGRIDTPAEASWHAHDFLLKHNNREVARGLVKLLPSDSEKVRDRVLEQLQYTDATWPTQIEDLQAAARREPRRARWLAAVGSPAALSALLELARDARTEMEAYFIGDAIQAHDKGASAAMFGFQLIDCDEHCAYPYLDTLIARIFINLVDTDGSDTISQRLLAILLDPSAATERRRRAFLAYRQTVSSLNDPDMDSLRKAFALSTGELRSAMATAYPNELRDDQARLKALLKQLASDPVYGLEDIAEAGPLAAALRPSVERILDGDDVELRASAARVLFAISPAQWRQRLPELARDPSPQIAYETLLMAKDESAEALAIARHAAATHWHPAVRAAADALATTTSKAGNSTDAPGESENVSVIHVSNDATFADALPRVCAEDVEPIEWAGLPSVMPGPVHLVDAGVAAENPPLRMSAALKVEDGWLLGTDEGEFGGSVTFSAAGMPSQDIVRSGTEVISIFHCRNENYVVLGSQLNPYDKANSDNWALLGKLEHSFAQPYVFKPVAQLPGPPNGIFCNDARLVITTHGGGAIDLSDVKRPHWIGCSPGER